MVAEFQTILNPDRRAIDLADLRRVLVDYPARICKIEIGEVAAPAFSSAHVYGLEDVARLAS